MQAEVELIAARFQGDRLRYLVGRQACATGIVHSTSWRYEHGNLLLTYIAYGDELPFDGLPQVLPREAHAVGADVTSVVAHAIRHLAFLVRQEPETYRRAVSSETRAHLAHVEPEVAGRIDGERAA